MSIVQHVPKNTQPFTKVYYALLKENISWAQKLIYAKLLSLQDERGGAFAISRKILAEWLGVSEPTVSRAIKELEKQRFITHSRTKRANLYVCGKTYKGGFVHALNTVLGTNVSAEIKIIISQFDSISDGEWFEVVPKKFAESIHMSVQTFRDNWDKLQKHNILDSKKENGKLYFKIKKMR
jgi:DNA-binding transcriptional regulator YhcF (GntR family)